MRITKLGVVGAGTMGSGIAALAASAGVPVVLLDVPGGDTPDHAAPAQQGVERAKKARPAAFMDPSRAAVIRTGNTANDLGLLADCDLVLEAIIEQPRPKQELYARLEPVVRRDAIIASNTSGIPMAVLTEGRSEAFRQRFLGMHFFNPPRYLHLLEIIPTAETSRATLDRARHFSERILGKGIVLAKDVPGFVANRLGVFGMALAIRMMERYNLSIDAVDVLTGALLARAKSATFRTADLTGLDVLIHVTEELSQATGEDFRLPDWVYRLVQSGRAGEKSGAGFYKKVGKDILTLDWKTLEYAPQRRPESPELDRVARLPLGERFAAVRELEGAHGDFAREYLLRFSQYVLEKTPVIAYDLVSVDRAMEWGYAWEAGPFQQMDLFGLDALRGGLARLGLEAPAMLGRAKGCFYHEAGAELLYLTNDGGYARVPEIPGAIQLASQKRWRRVLERSADATLVDMGDGVAAFEFTSKMNTLGEGVLDTLRQSLDRVRSEGLLGLVIGNDDPRTFTAGADLSWVMRMVQDGRWPQLEEAVGIFQSCSMSLRQAPFPVVVAPFGLTLGGGCEFTLHADRVQAHAELYIGLVEAGVGLLPAGGGTKELLFRFTRELEPYDEADPFEAVKRAFKLIAMATTSTSALDARRLGYLRDADQITMNRDQLLADAKARVLDLAPEYVAPLPRTIVALGGEAYGNLKYAAFAMRQAGQITDYEVTLAHTIAYVLSGGDGGRRTVTEQDILDLEREAFLKLLGNAPTQERISYMLKTGKPLRN
ncbi:MAG TPA: 3-hydroxyacyl-CoA dehydrogenase/enoyl-CoA hydratase family protein [Gemmatimonadaceae bacterium]|nr:3-hydroxyacyl-CoA dehydrogenase/enoyl-CoA hydratase family protein [Gemmatimonadaceae bacterium]